MREGSSTFQRPTAH